MTLGNSGQKSDNRSKSPLKSNRSNLFSAEKSENGSSINKQRRSRLVSKNQISNRSSNLAMKQNALPKLADSGSTRQPYFIKDDKRPKEIEVEIDNLVTEEQKVPEEDNDTPRFKKGMMSKKVSGELLKLE